MVICKVGDERVAMWQVMNCDGHDHADGCQYDSIWGRATLEACPGGCKSRLVDVTVYPIAIFKVIDDECVNGLESR
jgi:hypothetical protein